MNLHPAVILTIGILLGLLLYAVIVGPAID